MYARTVILQIDVDRWEEAMAFGSSIKDRIAAFPGLRAWTLTGDPETGVGTSFAVFDSREAFDAVNPQINEILSSFGEFFSGPPSETLGDVLISVDNVQ